MLMPPTPNAKRSTGRRVLPVPTAPTYLYSRFWKSQFPRKSVNVFSIIANIKNRLTNLCGN